MSDTKGLLRPWMKPGTKVYLVGPGAVVNAGPPDQILLGEIADHGGPICGRGYAMIKFPEADTLSELERITDAPEVTGD